MTDTPPDEVLIEAARRLGYVGYLDLDISYLRTLYHGDHKFRAMADTLVELGWKPPVDRKFECATEARREANESRKAWSEHDVAVRAIELWEEGFGK